jgi:hypothetical protein
MIDRLTFAHVTCAHGALFWRKVEVSFFLSYATSK